MPTGHRVRLEIELQAADRRVTGRLADECGERHSFGSWLDLLTLLEAARQRSVSSNEPGIEPREPRSRHVGRGDT